MRHPFDRFGWGNGFGPRVSPVSGASTLHLAQDYAVPRGTPIRAIGDGLITASYRTTPGGWWTVHRLDNGDTFGVCHSDARSQLVGQRVQEGQTINLSGNSGTATTGPHAHVTIKHAGVYVDPRGYINARMTSTASEPLTPIPLEEDMPLTKAEKEEIAQLAANEAARQVWSWPMVRADNSGVDPAGLTLMAIAARTYTTAAQFAPALAASGDDDLATIAQAVNDELDRRARARLTTTP